MALVAGELGGEGLGRAHDDLGLDGAERGLGGVRGEGGDRRALVDRHAELLDHVGEAAGEARRVDGGAVPAEHGAEAAGDLEPLARLGGAEHHVVVLAEAPGALVLELLGDTQQLHRVVREVELAIEVEAGVDLLVGDDALDLVDGVEEGALLGDDGLAAVRLRRAAA